MSTALAIGIVGFIIVLGVLLHLLSDRYRKPVILLLLFVGIIIGPILKLFDPYNVPGLINAFVTLALVIVLFDIGYSIKLKELKQNFLPSLNITIGGVLLSVLVVYLIARYLLHFDFLLSLLLGAMMASTDLTIVYPLLKNLRIPERLRKYLELEGTMNSVIAAILTIVIVTFLTQEQIFILGSGAGVKLFLYHLFVGMGIGLVLGYIILKVTQSLTIQEKPHIISLGAVLLVYAISEYLQASGIIAVLMVGIVFGNSKEPLPRIIKSFGGEIELLLITFVYILLGTLLKLEFFYIAGIVTILFVLAVILARAGMAYLFAFREDGYSKRIITFTGPRGVLTAVLILSYASLFGEASNIVLALGFSTIFITSFLVLVIPFLKQTRETKPGKPSPRPEPTNGLIAKIMSRK